MTAFSASCSLRCSAEEAFRWHERPGAFERLNPPWEPVKVLKHIGGIRDGATVTLGVPLGPFSLRWHLEHRDYVKGKQFKDIQLRGPFSQYEHTHRFTAIGPGETRLDDEIQFSLPLAPLTSIIAEPLLRSKLERVFRYRHRVTAQDLEAHSRFSHLPRQTILISGASGLVGSQLTPYLSTAGHTVKRLVRHHRVSGPNEISWDPMSRIDFPSLTGIDAVIHLAGDGIADGRWTAAKKASIRDSRVNGTRTLCESLLALTPRPKVLICASAIGFYGSCQDTILTEEAPSGSGFLADVTKEWEQATHVAADAGIRVVNLRFGIVLSPQRGALAKMRLPFSLGLGGTLGKGSHWMSWIGLDDVLGLIEHALHTETVRGPLNAVAPHPVTNKEFTESLGGALHRPTPFPIPQSVATLVFGELAREALFASTRAIPQKALDSGYQFRQPVLLSALRESFGNLP